MKTLLISYSRTGRTQAHMTWLKDALSAERMLTVRTKRPHTGLFGTLRACRDMISGYAEIEPPDLPPDMGSYDLVVLGGPVWAGRAAAPLRTFVKLYGQGIRCCAYVITHASADPCDKALDDLDVLTGVSRCAALSAGKGDTDAEDKREAFVKTVLEML